MNFTEQSDFEATILQIEENLRNMNNVVLDIYGTPMRSQNKAITKEQTKQLLKEKKQRKTARKIAKRAALKAQLKAL